MTQTAIDIATTVGGVLKGEPLREASHISAIDAPSEGSLSFIAHKRFHRFLHTDKSRIILVSRDDNFSSDTFTTLIEVDDVYTAFAKCSALFNPTHPEDFTAEISPLSKISSQASIGASCSIGAFTVIADQVVIGHQVSIAEQVYIGKGVIIGDHTIIMTGVKLMSGVQIGSHCIIYPNAVIGTDGFGHALNSKGHTKISHQGGVVIEDNVEIGANTVIDKGSIGNTIIRKGVKLDNLIQVAHGVEIGEGTVIAAQTGISGSSTIGEGCMIGGQVGIVGHISIAPGSSIQAKSGIASSITAPNKKWYGYPVIGYMNYLRSFAIFKRLPELLDRITNIESTQNDKSL